MLELFKNFGRTYERYMTWRGRSMACEVLRRCDDRTLADNGFSRDLLEQGVKGWPWHIPPDTAPALQLELTDRQAMAELSSFSDADLHDLGITRGTIAEAVTHGREGIEHESERKVA